MSERYTRVFTLPEKLYCEGSPVVISAGALLRDNNNGHILAQLKIKNLCDKAIKAAAVIIQPLNTVGEKLGGETEYKYLDLDALRNGEFGQKTLIPLPDNETRAYRVRVSEVIFADNTVCACDGEFTPLEKPTALSERFQDSELLKQYRLKYGDKCVCVPARQRDLWYCTCGELNRIGESCTRCGRSFDDFADFDPDALASDRDKRLEEEKAAREAKEAEDRQTAARNKKITVIAAAAAAVVIAVVLIITKLIVPSVKYSEAEKLMNAGQYEEAIAAFEAMDGYRDSDEQITLCKEYREQKIAEEKYNEALELIESEKYAEAIALLTGINYKDSEDKRLSCLNAMQIKCANTVATGACHSVGLKSDGTVVAVGWNEYGQCEVGEWTDIVAVAAGGYHTVGLKADGTVVAVGFNDHGQCNVEGWTDIVAVAAGGYHTVGLKADGTVVAVGEDRDGRCEVGEWTDIVAVVAEWYHTVGLKADGTVVAVGWNEYGQCEAGEWTDIVAVAAGSAHTVGLKADGTVVAVGYNGDGRCEVGEWTDIVAVAAGAIHTVGLKSDGTVVTVGNNEEKQCDAQNWNNIVRISAGNGQTLGLKSDGTVVAVGYNEDGQCDVEDWKNIKLP